jgi:hypothetical protein
MSCRVIATVKPFGQEVLCASCLTFRAGRLYDLRVTITAEGKAGADGVITLCEKCRRDFDSADNELDADAMYADSERRRQERDEDLEELEHCSPFLKPVEHTTFPRDVKRPVRG